VFQVAEAPGGEYNVDVIFEKDGKRFLGGLAYISL
jgi:hypothetical protein